MSAAFPLQFANEEASLLSAVVLGFLFGFTLERAGFGSPRKLAAQFYLHDMTVFKVMFTAIITAMVGLYGFAALGWVDLTLLWINPTFLWSQVVGGFLLGIGFIMSGLCPGTSVVSAMSGRIDAIVAFVGIFAGTLLFAVGVDVLPWLDALYHATPLGVSLLPEVFGMPAPLLALLVVLGAGAAFLGAEHVERRFSARHGTLDCAPAARPRLKLAVPGALALLALGATFAPRHVPEPEPPAFEAVAPGDVARRILERSPGLILDARSERTQTGVPGAHAVALDSTARALLEGAAAGQGVVVYDERGELAALPASWPKGPRYQVMTGGLAAWRALVLTPAQPVDGSTAERERVARQQQVAAFFSGARVSAPAAGAPPPAAAAGGGAKKKKSGGC